MTTNPLLAFHKIIGIHKIIGGVLMKQKLWCLHCETVSEVNEFANSTYCPLCSASPIDVEAIGDGGFFIQAYPTLEYDDVIIGKLYPLYP